MTNRAEALQSQFSLINYDYYYYRRLHRRYNILYQFYLLLF